MSGGDKTNSILEYISLGARGFLQLCTIIAGA
jgi:hypothetical protein